MSLTNRSTDSPLLVRGDLSFTLRLPVVPRGQERARHSRSGHAYTPAKTRAASKEIQDLWALAGRPVIEGEWFAADIFAEIKRPKSSKFPVPPRPDCDNIAKLVLDALQGCAFENDSRCRLLYVEKAWADSPMLTVTLSWVPVGGIDRGVRL